MSRAGNPDKVDSYVAMLALRNAGGDRKKAYSECVRLTYKLTGKFAPGFDNADLQAFYDCRGIRR